MSEKSRQRTQEQIEWLQRKREYNQRLRADAERYRFIRQHSYVELTCDSPRQPGFTLEDFDRAVDEAMLKS